MRHYAQGIEARVIEPVDAQELNRLLEEGGARLRRSREAIKNSPHRPAPWEDITPGQLRPAIEHLGKQLKSAEWQLRLRVECGCYLGLHPDLILEPKFKGGFENLIPFEKRPAWQNAYASAKESATFKFWSDQFAEGLAELIVEPFNAFLKIGLAQRSALTLEPVEWAKTLARNLIYSLEWTLPSKIKDMCDERRNRTDFANEHFLAYCAWVYWRAPRFVHMQPSGNTPYDPETAWERESEDETEDLLRGLTEGILDPARFKLDDLAGEAYVSLACATPAEQRQTENPASHAQRTGRGDDINLPSIEPRKDTKQLPVKTTDLSNYFDQAQLTDRQRECASLKHEYGLTKTAIADRLGLSRKTVDEHLAAAERRIQSARARDSAKGQRSRFNRGE
jgi:DNA-binding CsgD family transcriptional regulator